MKKLLETLKKFNQPNKASPKKPRKEMRLLWDSYKQGTYVKAKHGVL